ncbi:hypothetical protein [Marinomonas pollencensis]|uniref:Late embryogenesis abundant protein n=1 Tax=Marinomonas pollencensis TaxID=491954 RepID=A0A3E0DSX3_9GAMM|nr:hypothetical protein [Marinomonas pollencensis]REG86659.1 hypothetical protein DFP81_101224 [Marinomonas pollencensis]
MKMTQVLLKGALVMAFAGALAACNDDTSSSVEDTSAKVSDQVEQTMDEAGDAMDDAGDAISDQATDMGNAIEDTCEKAKEGMNAEDTDC